MVQARAGGTAFDHQEVQMTKNCGWRADIAVIRKTQHNWDLALLNSQLASPTSVARRLGYRVGDNGFMLFHSRLDVIGQHLPSERSSKVFLLDADESFRVGEGERCQPAFLNERGRNFERVHLSISRQP
jgi:transposase